MLNTAYNEQQEEKKHKVRGIITSVIVHALLLLLLWLFGLPYLDPPPPDSGILVNFGLTETGSGDQPSEVLEEANEVSPSEVTPTPSSSQQEINEVLTQEEEITAPIVKKEDPKKEVKKETPVVKETKTELVKETKEEPKKEEPTVDKRALFTGKKSTNNNPNNQGQAGGSGDQGKPWGDPSSNNYGDGKGKGTSGIGYDLGGRKHRDLPRPNDNSQATGIVVIKIRVDQSGNVAEASYQAKGSTTTDNALVQAAIAAARKAKFDPDSKAPEVQFGSITYNFKVQ
jgi:protein TonB